MLPSGIVRKGKISILGNGVVIDPWALLSEIEDINKQGIEVTPENFMISEISISYFTISSRNGRDKKIR